ncbi:MAG: Ig-like domain-containing protein [Cryobacterium sp.]
MSRARSLLASSAAARWVTRHRSAAASVLSSTVIVALVATVAVVSGGYTAQRVSLGDDAVWVANESRQSLGRANTAVLELNTAVPAASASIDVVQSGATVFAVNRGSDTVDVLNPATAELTDRVALPAPDPAVFLSSEGAMIAANGDIWTLPSTELADFDSATSPDLSLGAGSVLSLDAAGTAFSFTPATGTLVAVATGDGNRVLSTQTVDAGSAEDEYQLSSVAGQPALLNASTGLMLVNGNRVDLSGLLQGDPVLQGASLGGDEVLVAHRGGLVAAGLSGLEPTVLVDGRTGDAAAPTRVNGCDYAAWADGGAWQRCVGDSDAGSLSVLQGLVAGARLVFQVNDPTVVLNDLANGSVWAVQHDDALIDNWNDLIDVASNTDQIVQTTDEVPEFEDAQVPPVAVDDEFGARPGRSVTLPVLLNDYDANGDALVIDDFTQLAAQTGRLDLIGNNQQLQLTLPQDAAGTLSFDYRISDGRGGTAGATVTVRVRAASENSAPQQVRATSAQVEFGGRVTEQVLGDWVDPDGDPIYLTGATAVAPDAVAFTPAGAVTYTHGEAGGPATPGSEPGSVPVGLSVSDGTLTGTGTLQVGVSPVGSVPIVADTFLVLATAGTDVTVSPLEHVRGGSGTLRLTSVPARAAVTVTPDFVAGTFRFRSDVVGTHYLEYTVTDETSVRTGQVRVQVAAAEDFSGVPITVPHTAFVRGTEPTLVDVLSRDIDPGGGVLLVTGTGDVPPESGLRVEILEQNLLRVTLTRPLEGPVTFSYTVSNGFAAATGTVTVIELPALERPQAPLAEPDIASVRVGEVIDIPVLANDRHPDGAPLTLAATLTVGLDPGSGLLFTSGSVLRYLAPDVPGNFTAVYRVEAPDGQFANAEVRIAVREADAAANRAPAPATVTARVLAGATVRIGIPLSGIDPDGDSVQLLGQQSSPEKGSVTGIGPDWIDFTAGEYATGTDTFSYNVIDALGARATGLIRVGISPRLDGARNPVAVPDEVTVRPGSTVSVRVLANDSDPDNGTLTLMSVEPTDADGVAGVDGRVVVVQAPGAEGRTGFIYMIANERGGTASSFLTVIVDDDAPYARPDAGDTVLTLSDILDRNTVDVNVLSRVFFADGPVTDLGLQVPTAYAASASVLPNQRIRVTVREASQIIPFSLTHPQDPSIISYAFIRVPGFSDALPQQRTSMAPLTVPSGTTLKIDINDYVVAVGGAPVRLTDSGAVRATHADGADLVGADGNLVYTSASGYSGPASVSFEVTDARRPGDPAARTATIVLPILVTPRENQPPVFDGAVIDFEPGQRTTIDLHRLTAYPYPDALDELVYTVLDPLPVGFDYTLRGSTLVLHAADETKKGSRSAITVGVRDARSAGVAGRIQMRVVASSKPLAVPADDVVQARRGTTTVVDVLANDGATNPFPAVPLRVVAVRGLNGAGLPAGVSITPNASQNRLSIVVAADAEPVNTGVQYQVADATGDPDRFAWATVRVLVADVPEPVSGVTVTGFGDNRLAVSFRPGAANNSPISGFDVVLTGADSGRVIGSTACSATSCSVPTAGNGSANAVRVNVTARNAVGSSAAARLAGAVWSDVIPAAPGNLSAAPLDAALRVSWTPVGASNGSAVRDYVVTVNGRTRDTVVASACSAGACSVVVDRLTNGETSTITVSARNDAFISLTSWNSSSQTGTPYGAPLSGAITATASDADGGVTVAWDAFAPRGGPVEGYVVQRLQGTTVPAGAQACTVSSPAPGTVTLPSLGGVVADQKTVTGGTRTAVFAGLTGDNGSYSFVVWGYNKAGCTATAVTTVLVRTVPGLVTAVQGSMQNRVSGTGLDATASRDYRLTGATASGPVSHYEVRSTEVTRVIPAGGLWPRELNAQAAFGGVVGFDVRACNSASGWSSCGEWSAFAAPEASVTFTVPGLAYDAAAGVFSWTNDPDNGAELSPRYTCRVGDTAATDAQSPTSCTMPAPVDPAATAQLTVTVNGQSVSFKTR